MRRASLGRALVTMLSAAAAGLLLLNQIAAQPSGAMSDTQRFVGVYELARYAGHGDEPTGRISYDDDGRMWAILAPHDRTAVSNDSPPEDYVAAMRGLVAYYGTYDVDEETGRVVHHVEAASNTAWVGDDFTRWYRFEDGDLVLSLNPDFLNPLLWARLPEE